MSESRVSTRLVGAIFVASILVLTVVIFSGAFRKPFEDEASVVTVDFERAPQLHVGDQVRIEGNIEGKVTAVEPAPVPEEARVTMELDSDAGPIYADASARISAKTLLGGTFYVALDRGDEESGELGDEVIPTERTGVQVEVEDLTGVFRAGAVSGLQTLPGELADALSDPGPPTEAFRILNDVAKDAGIAVAALRGQNPGDDIPKLIDATAKTVEALDTGTNDLEVLVSGAAATLQVTGGRADEIRETIDAGPAIAHDLTFTLARLDRTLEVARGLIDRLQPAAPLVAPTLSELRPTLVDTDALLEEARPLLGPLRAAVLSVGDTSRAGVTLLNGLRPSLHDVGDTILPYLHREDPVTGHNTTVMIGGTAAGFGGSSAQQDANGHFIRFPATFGTSSVYLPCTSSFVDPYSDGALACDSFNEALDTYLQYLPSIPGLGNEVSAP